MAGATGLEPAASAVTGQRSNQLSYAPNQRKGSLPQSKPKSQRENWTSQPALLQNPHNNKNVAEKPVPSAALLAKARQGGWIDGMTIRFSFAELRVE